MRKCLLLCLLAGLMVNGVASGSAEGEGIVQIISAESYVSKEPGVADPVDVSEERRAAREAKIDKRFHPGDRCLYSFEVPTRGEYGIYLRFFDRRPKRGNRQRDVRVEIDPGTPRAQEAVAELRGRGLYDPPNLALDRLWLGTLDAGAHTLAIQNLPTHPWALAIVEAGAQKGREYRERLTDLVEAMQRALAPELTDDMRARLARPVEPIAPDWLVEEAKYELPEWYDRWRVCAHTRLTPAMRDKDFFFRAAEIFGRIGFKTYSRHIKSGDEGAWWPSKVGEVWAPAQSENIAKRIIDNAHEAGCWIIPYHRHMEDEGAAEAHPDWVCRDWNGEPFSTWRGDYMCMNSPYADYFLTRMLELTDMGADGFYFDERHMPKTGCWCSYCRAKFKEETGLDHPARVNMYDPVWWKLVEFNNATIERTFVRWRRAVHARNPECVFIVSANVYPGMDQPYYTHRLMRVSDVVKTEFSLANRRGQNRFFDDAPHFLRPDPDLRVHMGYALVRDGADGRPPHVWTHGVPTATSAVFATAGMLTHGAVPNLDQSERDFESLRFAPAVAMGNKASEYLVGRRPARWLAVHFSEHARDRFGPDFEGAWAQALYPVFGAYKAAQRARWPIRIVNDSQLEQGLLDGHRVLYLPTTEFLTDRMKASVDAFKAKGGVVLKTPEAWKWHDPDGQAAAIAGFRDVIVKAVGPPPVDAVGGPEKMSVVAHTRPDGSGMTICLANDFSWVYTGKWAKEVDEDTTMKESQKIVPPPCRGVTVRLRGREKAPTAREVLTDRPLTVTKAGEAYEIALPDFEAMSVVAIED